MEQTANPLSKFFRQPAIYLKLPTKGQYWPQGSLNLGPTNELAIYPMTARDEILLRTPDALMNGSGVVEVIQSCCPEITDAWNCPNPDLDAILIAIRIASYGVSMDFNSQCPHCKHSNTHQVDLTKCLESIESPDYKEMFEFENLKFKLKPVSFFKVNRENTINFEEQKILQALENPEISNEVKADEVARSMQRIINMNIEAAAMSTEYIELPDGNQVRLYNHILEFYNNAKSQLLKKFQEHVAKINENIGLKPIDISCNECEKAYIVPLEFDFANFFDRGF